MRVVSLDAVAPSAVEEFVERTEEATFFHDLRWLTMLQKVAGFESQSLALESNGRLHGILPLFAVRSPFAGFGLVSTPFAVYGGIIADDEAGEKQLVEATQKLVTEKSAKFAELRQSQRPMPELPQKDLYVTFVGDLPEDPAECLTRIPRKSRASARQGRDRHHLEFITGWHLIDPFYELFVLNKRSLGSPVFSMDFFSSFFDYFPDQVFLHGVKHQGEVVACVMSFGWRDTLMAYYSGSLGGTERLGTMNFMYWKLMEWATRRGFKKFDFGRSRAETGAYSFKRNMGFSPTPLPYQFVLNQGVPMPDVNPGNPKFDLVKGMWRRLPVGLVKKAGPKLIRYFP